MIRTGYKNILPRYAGGKSSIIDTLDDDLLDTLHYINDYFSNLGMSTTDIAGIAANMFKESSFRHNAKDGAGYHGYVQMSPDMLLAVKAAYGNLDPDTQLLFVYDQLTGNSKVKGYTNGAGYLYGLYKTGGDAAEAFRSTFERNKSGRQQSRIDYGNLIYDYLSNRAVENTINKEVGEQPMPIIARPDATVVKKIVPKAKTRARWTGADNVSPYLTGKPIVKLLKEVKLPNIIEENKKTLWKTPMGFKNGKLPGFKDGTKGWTRANGNDIKFDEETGELVDQVTGEKGTMMLPEVTIKPRHYDAYNSTYNPNLIRNFTDFAPIIGDIGQGLDAYNAFKNKDYTTAAVLGGLTLLPNVAENIGKYTYRGLRQLGLSQEFSKELLQNGEAAWKRFKNLDIFDKLRGITYTDNVYHGSRNMFDIDHARAYAPGGMDTGFHMGSSPTPTYSRANGLLGGVLYSGKLKLKEAPFELNDLNRWGYREIVGEADNNPAFKKYLEDKGIDIDKLLKKGSDLDDEYFKLDANQQKEYLELHGGFLSDKYMADLFKKKNISFKYKNDFETFDGIPEYSYAIYNPENVVWKRPFKFSRQLEDLEKLYGLGIGNKYDWNDPDRITIHLDDLYRILNDFPKYRLPGYKNGKSSIHINPANRGKFNATKKRTGKTTEELAHSKNPLTRKRAIFALNSRKWHHK